MDFGLDLIEFLFVRFSKERERVKHELSIGKLVFSGCDIFVLVYSKFSNFCVRNDS